MTGSQTREQGLLPSAINEYRAAGTEICKTFVGNCVFVYYQRQAKQITTDMLYTTILNVRGVRPNFARW